MRRESDVVASVIAELAEQADKGANAAMSRVAEIAATIESSDAHGRLLAELAALLAETVRVQTAMTYALGHVMRARGLAEPLSPAPVGARGAVAAAKD